MDFPTPTFSLLRFPRDDDEFLLHVEDLTGRTPNLAVLDPVSLQQRLRARYPQAVVRVQDPFGGINPAARTWYIYRDGAPVAQTG